jgi:hypothetical protein
MICRNGPCSFCETRESFEERRAKAAEKVLQRGAYPPEHIEGKELYKLYPLKD